VTALAPGLRPLPLVAVLYRIPLLVEALAAAFEGLAELSAVRRDDSDVDGLIEALKPDALIVEDREVPGRHGQIPAVHVELEGGAVHARRGGEWTQVGVDLTPEAIRNAVLRAMLGGGS
jgi:hypothetical protein